MDVSDVVGMSAEEGRRIIEAVGYRVGSERITRPPGSFQQAGETCRILRVSYSGPEEVELVLGFEVRARI